MELLELRLQEVVEFSHTYARLLTSDSLYQLNNVLLPSSFLVMSPLVAIIFLSA